jgi:hypothetical protein
MTAATNATLDRYLRHRRGWEIALWAAWWLLDAAANSAVAIMDIERRDLQFAWWEPVVWEYSSALMLLVLLPAQLALDRRFPFGAENWRRAAAAHLAATIPYSLMHVFGMVGLRHLAYGVAGSDYDFGDWPKELLYEYLKDVRTYAVVLIVVHLYRLLLLRLRGEVRLLTAPDAGLPADPIERPSRFLVRKLGAEFLVAAHDIEFLEAAENYVNLHVRGRVYPLRSTMTGIQDRLDPARFVRVHRSYIVNLDFLDLIEPLETGDARLLLKNGLHIPCSRRYRSALRPACSP